MTRHPADTMNGARAAVDRRRPGLPPAKTAAADPEAAFAIGRRRVTSVSRSATGTSPTTGDSAPLPPGLPQDRRAGARQDGAQAPAKQRETPVSRNAAGPSSQKRRPPSDRHPQRPVKRHGPRGRVGSPTGNRSDSGWHRQPDAFPGAPERGGYPSRPAGAAPESHGEANATLPVDRGPEAPLWLRGRHEVLAALEGGTPVAAVFLADGSGGPGIGEVVAAARRRGVKFTWLPAAVFRQRFGAEAQGVVAERGAYVYADFAALVARLQTRPMASLVLLREVQDPRNLGAIVRSCEAGGVDGVVIPRHRAAAMTAAALATAQGAAEFIPVAQVVNLGEAVRLLRRDGWWVIGADAGGPCRYDRARYTGRVALVMGGEDAGLGPLLTGLCDEVVTIPMLGRTPSLNVAVSTSVLVFEMQRQRGFAAEKKPAPGS